MAQLKCVITQMGDYKSFKNSYIKCKFKLNK